MKLDKLPVWNKERVDTTSSRKKKKTNLIFLVLDCGEGSCYLVLHCSVSKNCLGHVKFRLKKQDLVKTKWETKQQQPLTTKLEGQTH